jgi:hypothetical protein
VRHSRALFEELLRGGTTGGAADEALTRDAAPERDPAESELRNQSEVR